MHLGTKRREIAIVKKDGTQDATKKVADWLFSSEGQRAMARSFMYPAVRGEKAPEGAPEFSQLQATAQPWTRDFIGETLKDREEIKNKFAKIIF